MILINEKNMKNYPRSKDGEPHQIFVEMRYLCVKMNEKNRFM